MTEIELENMANFNECRARQYGNLWFINTPIAMNAVECVGILVSHRCIGFMT